MTYSFEKGYLVIKVETGKYEDKVVGVYAGEDKNGKSLFSNHIIEDSYEKIGNYEIKIKLKKTMTNPTLDIIKKAKEGIRKELPMNQSDKTKEWEKELYELYTKDTDDWNYWKKWVEKLLSSNTERVVDKIETFLDFYNNYAQDIIDSKDWIKLKKRLLKI